MLDDNDTSRVNHCDGEACDEHDAAEHKRIRSDEDRWNALPLLGVQHRDDRDYVIELRNCSCGSTLGRVLRRLS